MTNNLSCVILLLFRQQQSLAKQIFKKGDNIMINLNINSLWKNRDFYAATNAIYNFLLYLLYSHRRFKGSQALLVITQDDRT